MVLSKETIKQELTHLLERVFGLPEINKVQIRGIDIYSAEEDDKINESIEACYHDVLSDIDIGIHVTLHPEDIGNGQGYYTNPERMGLTRDKYLGLAFSDSNDILFQMYRVILKNGVRFDIGFYITEDFNVPIYHIIHEIKEEIKDTGKVWPRWDLRKADNFWFVEILALAKLKRGDYLIADHLANMQINETLVAQMLERDDFYGKTFHRYGYREELDYNQDTITMFKFDVKGETYNKIAHKILSAAISYDRLIKRSNPLYEERSDIFIKIWNCYEASL